MPFKIDDSYTGDTVDFGNGHSAMLIGQKFYIIDTSEVDQEHDRLAIVLSYRDESVTCRLSLDPSPVVHGLLMDTFNSDPLFIEVITANMRLGDLHQMEVKCELGDTDPGQHKMILPAPINFLFYRGGEYLNGSELFVIEGGTIRLESQTIS